MLVKHFPKNETGRDFVVGDLHGCFDLLMTALTNIGFDRSTDRLFSVGDLIDRGPHSLSCLYLTKEPWFHATMANHEYMMYMSLLGGKFPAFLWYRNGGGWYNDLGFDEQMQVRDYCLDYVQYMPWLITVESSFHVLHADLESTESLTDADLLEGNFQEFAEYLCEDGEVGLWGRGIFYHLCGKNLTDHDIEKWKRGAKMHRTGLWAHGPNLLPVYVGHTPVNLPTRCWAVTNLDTYAYGTTKPRTAPEDGLTITEPLTDRFWLTNNEGTKEVQVKVVV